MPSHDRPAPGREPFTARPVSLLPSDVLACAALTTPLLRDALRLARWSAPATPLTAEGLPYPDEAHAAVGALGLWPHGLDTEITAWAEWPDQVDAATADAARLALPWRTAVRLGLLEATADWAGPAPDLEERVRDPEQVLIWWSGVFEASVGRARDDSAGPGFPCPGVDGPCLVLTVLRFLYEAPDGFGVPFPVLLRSVLGALGGERGSDDPLPSRDQRWLSGRILRVLRLLDSTGGVALAAEADEVDATGAAAESGADDAPRRCPGHGLPAVELTPLGKYGVRRLLEAEGVHAPLVGSLAGAGAAEFLDALEALPPDRLFAEIGPWLDARTPTEALSQIVAVVGGPGQALRRWTGTKVLDATSSEIEPELRALLFSDRPSVVSLSAIILLTSGMLSSEDIERLMAGRGHWIVIDMIAAAAERSPEDPSPFLSADGAPDIEQLVLDDPDRLWSPEHPDTLPVLDTISRHHPDASTAARARDALRARALAPARGRHGSRHTDRRTPVRPRPSEVTGSAPASPGCPENTAEGSDADRPEQRERFRVRDWLRRGRGRHRAQGQDHP